MVRTAVSSTVKSYITVVITSFQRLILQYNTGVKMLGFHA